MTKEELKKLMAGIFVEYGIKVCADRFAAWWLVCEEVPSDMAQKALPVMLKKKTFGPPKVADFLECVKQLQDAENPQKQHTEGDVWGMVMEAVRRYGYYNEAAALAALHAVDPKIAQTARNFRWRTICEGDASQNNTLRAQFLKAWHSLRNRQDLLEQLKIGVTPIPSQYGPNPLTGDSYALPLDLERKFKAIGSYKDKSE